MIPRCLADTSAWIKGRRKSSPTEVQTRFNDLLLAGEIVICDLVKLELLHAERSPARFASRRRDLEALAWCPVGPVQFSRAIGVAELMSKLGPNRLPRLPDYLISAAAESAGLTVLHYDVDFELIANVTGQPHEWLAPRGEV